MKNKRNLILLTIFLFLPLLLMRDQQADAQQSTVQFTVSPGEPLPSIQIPNGTSVPEVHQSMWRRYPQTNDQKDWLLLFLGIELLLLFLFLMIDLKRRQADHHEQNK
ncbi:LPXTG cell wall anchor domain-containing protein [Enterococcus florum]|uniref:LPXTG cell wall anchor domain-containing protein n=1 Tax=Enterococcus florum TaxID=2480627 RepID=UPI0011BABB37|nr:LPXTG cell wall anchor domain-containing protein [Enterococcus florum]